MIKWNIKDRRTGDLHVFSAPDVITDRKGHSNPELDQMKRIKNCIQQCSNVAILKPRVAA
jgi:hypothetical protein